MERPRPPDHGSSCSVLRPGTAEGAIYADGQRRVGLLNNMPDGAFRATERQISQLLAETAVPVTLLPYALDGIDRSSRTQEYVGRCCWPADMMARHDLDALIVTGAEPKEADLTDEAYWPALLEIILGALDTVGSVLVSCLAAHVALLALDDLQRVRLPRKLSGVYRQRANWGHRLTSGLADDIAVPHSRLNEVPTTAVLGAGWQLVVSDEPARSGAPDDHGWAVISTRRGDCELTAVQGHPEYDRASLLREYRRDAERYLAHRVDNLPRLPDGCVGPSDLPALEAFDASLASGQRDIARLGAFDFSGAAKRANWVWRDAGAILYRNWLGATVAVPRH